ncbi:MULTISPECIES: hypothetical protein [unclassified Paraburkholderia]|uniref:hypothetical protein n=1 Tax=unclassified Paraburkholderia TaxID=2615204 RepID=UPI002AB2F594|nr:MULTISPECIES: hypothetical protein [unclassified Paraburkholderia]
MFHEDRELLARAARAAGIVDFEFDETCSGTWAIFHGDGHHTCWNPLDDDGDALRLAVRLSLHMQINAGGEIKFVVAGVENPDWDRYCDPDESKWTAEVSIRDDACAATRRAIVIAAASCADA